MLVCMFELGFKVGSAPLMEPQAAFYIYKLAMGFLSQHALRAVCNVCTHYKQLMSINIYRGGQNTFLISKLRFTYYNVQLLLLFV